MNYQKININQPVTVAFAPVGGKLTKLVKGLSCHDFKVKEVETLPDLETVIMRDHRYLRVFLIDATVPDIDFEECIESIDPAFRDANGPVIAVIDSEGSQDTEALKAKGASKVFDVRLGQRALRLLISIEIEEFDRVRLLRSELRKRSSAIGQIVKGEFRFKTRREAQNLATMLSMTCPNPMPIAIGLTELFINGVEHGCLGIGHDEKGRLIEEGILAEEIERRRALPEYCDRVVTVVFRREPNCLYFEVHDGGDGFDFMAYLDNSEGHSKKHGRGIMMAKGCFESLSYKGNGNQVHAVHHFGGGVGGACD